LRETSRHSLGVFFVLNDLFESKHFLIFFSDQMQRFPDQFRQQGMKKIIVFLVAGFTYGSTASAQCCPYVDPIEILPASPFDTDSIYVATSVTTPNMGAYLGYEIIDQGSTKRIEACYYSGMLTALQTYKDTINLGLLTGGTYSIVFVAYQTDDAGQCIPTDSNIVSSTVNVISTLVVDEGSENSILLYPNPVQGDFLYVENHSGNEIPFRIVNVLGETVLQGTTGNAGEINVSELHGVFFITLFQEQTILTRQVLID
jgi:hypothetical protein